MIVSKTPFRVSYVGGGSDFATFYREEPGAVISTSIQKYMYIVLNKKFDGRIRLSYSKTEEVDYVHEIQHPLVKEALIATGILDGIEIASLADIPSKGTGLGSSSAYLVGLLHALFAYKNQYATKQQLAEIACDIEINKCCEPIGKQDQYAAAFGGLNLIRFHPDESVSVDPVICNKRTLDRIQESTLIFYTGLTRNASKVLSEQSRLSAANKSMLRRMVQLSFDLKAELEDGIVDNFGAILNENWQLKKELASSVSTQQIDEWYRIGISNGATGGKLLGAGSGGFLLFFAPFERHNQIIKALSFLKLVNFPLDTSGSQIVFYQPNLNE